jgi:hypothetical protein
MKRVMLLACAGCFAYSSPPAERPPPVLRKIGDATILDMKVHLHKQPGLCPGREGKLYANANVQWPGSKPVPRSIGADTDSLQPSDFVVTGPLLKGDANAHLFPDADVLKSVESGFQAKVVYKPNPKFSFQETFPPEYSCYTGWYDDGAFGSAGRDGAGGGNSGNGTPGTNGAPGNPGEVGKPGGRIAATVTIVSTKYYPRLFAVIANNHFFLAPSDRELTFGAAGGQGGGGGNGGYGGDGGDQPTETRGTKTTYVVGVGPAGNGGNGGSGGRGGDGGPGGTVEVIYDSAFPELARAIVTDVRGGAAGLGGAGGNGGAGGGTNAEKNAQQGNPGNGGAGGANGQEGRPGRATVRAGSVQQQFAGLTGVTLAAGRHR